MSQPLFPREPVPIAPEALNKWALLPDNAELSFRLNKFQIEDAYFLFRKTIEAQGHLQQALIHYSNNNIGYAAESMRLSQEALQNSQNELNLFLSALMKSAEVKR